MSSKWLVIVFIYVNFHFHEPIKCCPALDLLPFIIPVMNIYTYVCLSSNINGKSVCWLCKKRKKILVFSVYNTFNDMQCE